MMRLKMTADSLRLLVQAVMIRNMVAPTFRACPEPIRFTQGELCEWVGRWGTRDKCRPLAQLVPA